MSPMRIILRIIAPGEVSVSLSSGATDRVEGSFGAVKGLEDDIFSCVGVAVMGLFQESSSH